MASRNEARMHKTRRILKLKSVAKRHHHSAFSAISYGREAVYHMRKHISCSEAVYHRTARPCYASGWQIVPLKIAASGAKNCALLAMTKLIGLEEIRNVDSNRERRCTAEKVCMRSKTYVFQTKTSQFHVIARPHRGRGNLKAIGMASRSKARMHKTRRILKLKFVAKRHRNVPRGHGFTQASACTSPAPADFTRP